MALSAYTQDIIRQSIETQGLFGPEDPPRDSIHMQITTRPKTRSEISRENATFAIDPARDAGRNSWQNQSDPRTRKRIQDRLAQRARRKRLAELKQKSARGEGSTIDNQDWNVELQGTEQETKALLRAPTVEQSMFDTLTLEDGLTLPQFCPIPLISNDHTALRITQLSICAALYVNGLILGLTCSHVEISKSKPPQPTTPLALQPTPLQLQTDHIPWLDRFPFPSMRDNAIVLANSKVIDLQAFHLDLFLMRSFELREGGVSWDPKAWRIGPEFGAKWGWLFC